MKIKRIEFVFQATMDLIVTEHPESRTENISELAVQLFSETQASDIIKRDEVKDKYAIDHIRTEVRVKVQETINELSGKIA